MTRASTRGCKDGRPAQSGSTIGAAAAAASASPVVRSCLSTSSGQPRASRQKMAGQPCCFCCCFMWDMAMLQPCGPSTCPTISIYKLEQVCVYVHAHIHSCECACVLERERQRESTYQFRWNFHWEYRQCLDTLVENFIWNDKNCTYFSKRLGPIIGNV